MPLAIDAFWLITTLGAVALAAWPLSYAVPFYRRTLESESRERLTPLDGLRGILAFAVMLHHSANPTVYHDLEGLVPPMRLYLHLGELAVSLFFCLTAFLFWSRAIELNGNIEPLPFLRGRVFRVGPLFIFSCLAAEAFVIRYVDFRSIWTYIHFGRIGLLGIRPWGAFGTPDARYINGTVTWTLSYEWGFYFLLPMLAFASRAPASRLLWLVVGLGVMIGETYALFFLPGIVAAYAVRNHRLSARLTSTWVSIAVLAVAAGYLVFIQSGYSYPGLALIALIFLPIACGNSMFGVLQWRPLRLMGLVSYSIYLLHAHVLWAAQSFLVPAAKRGDGMRLFRLEIVVLAIIVLAVCLLTYRWVEFPFIQMERRLRRRRTLASIPTEAAVIASAQ